MIKNLLKNTFKFDKQWWVGSVLLILISVFIFFGLHPHYRFVGIIVMLIADSKIFEEKQENGLFLKSIKFRFQTHDIY